MIFSMRISSIGERIRAIRNLQNLSQLDFAKKIGKKSYQAIQNWELGKITPPNSVLLVISKVFGVSYEWLMTGEGDMSKSSSNYQSITGSGNIQVNSGSVNQSKYDNLSNELKELFDLFLEFPIPSIINETKEKLLKYKNIK